MYVIVVVIAAYTAGCKRGDASCNEACSELYKPVYASGFRILGDTTRQSVVIESLNPWQGADGVVKRLWIERGGESAPEGFDGKVLHGTPRRVVVMSSSQVAMLDLLGEANSIVGISGRDYVYSPTLQARRDSIAEVGHEGALDYEALAGALPDLVMLYGVNSANPMEQKLDELGIPYIYIGDYLEQSPLAKAEWMVVIAEIMGKRQQGIELFTPISSRYEVFRAVGDSLRRANGAVKVMFNTPYGDSWFMPGSSSYAVRLIEDAGGEYIYKQADSIASRPIDMEEVYLLGTQANVWLHTGTFNTLRELRSVCGKMTDTPIMHSGRIYNNMHRQGLGGGSDYWESGVVHPELILRDLIKILHPSAFPADTLTYYNKVN